MKTGPHIIELSDWWGVGEIISWEHTRVYMDGTCKLRKFPGQLCKLWYWRKFFYLNTMII